MGLLLTVAVALLSSCGLTSAVWHRYRVGAALRRAVREESARLERRGSIPVVHLCGTYREMGRQQGRLLGDALRSMLAYLRAVVPADQMKRLLAEAELYRGGLPPEHEEELRAMAEASGVRFGELLALNVLPRLHCSALAVWGETTADGSMILGRNADYFGMGLADRGSVIVVYHPAAGQSVAAISFLGMIGAFTGVNDRGVVFGNMLVFNAADDLDAGGLPVQLAMRMAGHRATSSAEFAEFMRQCRHIIPMNAIVADANEALVLELGHGSSRVLRGARDVLAVSNHFRSEDLRSYPDSCPRLAALEACAAMHRGRFDAERMKEALYDARIPDLNLQAVVFEPGRTRMHASVNRVPASRGPYATFDLRALFGDPGSGGTGGR